MDLFRYYSDFMIRNFPNRKVGEADVLGRGGAKKTLDPLPVQGFLKWWRLPELNWGHADFQSAALPTELSRRKIEARSIRERVRPSTEFLR